MKAAKLSGLGVNEWVCEVMQIEADRQLGMNPPPQTREALGLILLKLNGIERLCGAGKGKTT